LSGVIADFSGIKQMWRKRGHSEEVDFEPVNSGSQIISTQKWKDLKFTSEDDRISKFIDYMHEEPNNTSQLLNDFEEWYLEERTELKMDSLKRLFFG